MNIYAALNILESTDTVDLRELTDWTEEEYNGAVRTLLREYKQDKKDSEEVVKRLNSRISDLEQQLDDNVAKLQNIQEAFLKYDWKESTNEQIYNQLKEIYDNFLE